MSINPPFHCHERLIVTQLDMSGFDDIHRFKKRYRNRDDMESEHVFKSKRFIHENFQKLSLSHDLCGSNHSDSLNGSNETKQSSFENVMESDTNNSTDRHLFDSEKRNSALCAYPLSGSLGKGKSQRSYVDDLIENLIRKSRKVYHSERESCILDPIPSNIGPSPTVDHAISKYWPVVVTSSKQSINFDNVENDMVDNEDGCLNRCGDILREKKRIDSFKNDLHLQKLTHTDWFVDETNNETRSLNENGEFAMDVDDSSFLIDDEANFHSNSSCSNSDDDDGDFGIIIE